MKYEIVKGDSQKTGNSDSEGEGLFAGMFTINGKVYAADKKYVYEMKFNDPEDKIVFKSVVSF